MANFDFENFMPDATSPDEYYVGDWVSWTYQDEEEDGHYTIWEVTSIQGSKQVAKKGDILRVKLLYDNSDDDVVGRSSTGPVDDYNLCLMYRPPKAEPRKDDRPIEYY